jgi:hypothetical protein
MSEIIPACSLFSRLQANLSIAAFNFAFLAPQMVCETTAAMMIEPPMSAQLVGRSPRKMKTQMGFNTGSI